MNDAFLIAEHLEEHFGFSKENVVALVHRYFCHRFLFTTYTLCQGYLRIYIFIHFICSVYAVMSIFMKWCLICHIDSYKSLWNHVKPCSFEICVLHDVLPGKRKNVQAGDFWLRFSKHSLKLPIPKLQVDEEKRPTRVNILQKLQWLVRTDSRGLLDMELVVQTDRELVVTSTQPTLLSRAVPQIQGDRRMCICKDDRQTFAQVPHWGAVGPAQFFCSLTKGAPSLVSWQHGHMRWKTFQ